MLASRGFSLGLVVYCCCRFNFRVNTIEYRLVSNGRKGMAKLQAKIAFLPVALLALIFAVACSFSLTACSSQSASSAATDDSRPVIQVGSDNYPPYNYLDVNGTPTGIDIDILTEAFDRMGYQVNFSYINWEDKKTLLANGEIDVVCGSFSMDGREDDYRWAGPYMTSREVVAVDPESSIQTLADLAGKTVAVQTTTQPEKIFLNNTNPNVPEIGKLYSVGDRMLMYPLVSKGYVDALAAHEASILQYEKDYSVSYRILDESLKDVGLGYAFDKNDTRGIAEQLDATLSQMHEDGTLAKIVGQYLDNAEKYLTVDASDE